METNWSNQEHVQLKPFDNGEKEKERKSEIRATTTQTEDTSLDFVGFSTEEPDWNMETEAAVSI